ncbi:DUF6074 family protein [Mesorhizobium sp. ASY16-5R]|uniref:DUF6074 family protein n=1 Tax=Mesorhizobium sp. ASY16-5R TaxID=3445772 RepID=UPI003F9ECA84
MVDLIIFPMTARVGRIRDVATKMLEKPTDRAAEYYRRQVTEAILVALVRLGVGEIEQDEHLERFWAAVRNEIVRQTYSGHTGDAA